MKKLLFWAAGLLTMFSACQQEEFSSMEKATSQTITVSIPEGVLTKATAADFGQGAHINRCILQVYHNNQPYGEKLVAAVNDQKQATFNLRLVTSQTYDFVFWADKANGSTPADFTDLHYNTTNLTAISVNGTYTGNNDEFDAFTAVKKGYKVEGAFTENITLKRPFGQLNVKTLDMDDVPTDLQPNKVKVTLKDVPTSFNALTGTVSEETAPVEYTADLLCTGTENVEPGELTVDYIWAESAENASIVNFSMTFLKDDAEISKNDAFTNIPIRRNYRTNVSGNLLTKQGSFNVTVNPDFETPDIDATVQEVNTAADITEAIKNGARNIVVKTAPTSDVTISLPHTLTDEQAAQKVTITLPATEQNITINYTTETTGKATQEIELFVETTGKLTLNLPESTVILRGSVGELDATTAPNTLVIPEGVTVGKLTVKQGNVEVYGTVNELVSKPVESIITLHISTAERLLALAENYDAEAAIYNKYMLENDIDLNNQPFMITKAASIEFDGQGHKVSNFIVKNKQAAGFFCDAISVSIRNLILENA